MQNKDNKLGQSLLTAITGGKDQDEAIEVDPFDQAKSQGIQPPKSTEEQTSSVEPEKRESAPDSDQAEVSQPQIDSEKDLVEKEPVRVRKQIRTKTKPKLNIAGVMSGVSLFIAVLAIVGVIFSFSQLDGTRAAFNQKAGALSEQIDGIHKQLVSHTSSISSLQETNSATQKKLVKLSTLEKEQMVLRSSINVTNEDVEQFGLSAGNNADAIKEQGDALEELTAKVAELSKKRTRPVVAKTTSTRKAKPKPVVKKTSVIEGATLATIDTWGSETYANLLDADGNWVSLKIGDYYGGWRLSAVMGDSIVFSKSGKNKTISKEG